MGRIFQPFESHIPYGLQVFIDHNLFGMGFINVETAYFRYPLPKTRASSSETMTISYEHDSPSSHTGNNLIPSFALKHILGFIEPISALRRSWLAGSVDSQFMSNLPRMSRCELEVDVRVEGKMTIPETKLMICHRHS